MDVNIKFKQKRARFTTQRCTKNTFVPLNDNDLGFDIA